jgi:hypothetical protein
VFFDRLVITTFHGSEHWSKLKPIFCPDFLKMPMDRRVHFFDVNMLFLCTSVNDIMGAADTYAHPHIGYLVWFTFFLSRQTSAMPEALNPHSWLTTSSMMAQ